MRHESPESRLKRTFFCVEATDFEQFTLWQQHAKNSSERVSWATPLEWEQIMDGWALTIGKVGKRPVCLSVSWANIEGCLVMFYYQCSQVTDSLQMEKWIAKNFKGTYDNGTRRALTDANNFGHCLSAIRDYNKALNGEV